MPHPARGWAASQAGWVVGRAGRWAGSAPHSQAAQLGMEQRTALREPLAPAHPTKPHPAGTQPPSSKTFTPGAPTTPCSPKSSPEKLCWFW